MKHGTIAGIVLLLVCGSAYAVDYTWTGGAVTENWDCTAMWTPSGVPGIEDDCSAGVADGLNMPANVATGGARCVLPNGTTLYLGTLTLDNGTLGSPNGGGQDWFDLRVAGNFVVTGTGTANTGAAGGYLDPGQGAKNWEIGGDFLMRDGGIRTYRQQSTNVTMTGSGKTVDIDEKSYEWNSFTIANSASVTTGTGGGAEIWTRGFTVNGTFSGGVNIGAEGSATTSVVLGPSGAWTSGLLNLSHSRYGATGTATVRVGGGQYPSIDTFGLANRPGDGQNRYVRQMGDVTLTGNLTVEKYGSAGVDNAYRVWSTDNGDGRISNLTVQGSFTGGGGSLQAATSLRGLEANSSTIEIQGNALFDAQFFVKGGTSTWKFGGDVTWASNANYDNTDMSQTTVHVDGSGAQKLDIGSKVALGNVIVNKSGGALTLDDNVLLVGNLSITGAPDSFAITNATDGIIFKGGIDNFDNAQTIDAGGADLIDITIAAGSNTYVKLLSDLAVSDNLNIAAGCKLFIGTHTLNLTGSDAAAFLGQNVLSGAGVWTVAEGGEIIGSGVIPEPSTLLLLGTGLIGAVGYVRRRRMR